MTTYLDWKTLFLHGLWFGFPNSLYGFPLRDFRVAYSEIRTNLGFELGNSPLGKQMHEFQTNLFWSTLSISLFVWSHYLQSHIIKLQNWPMEVYSGLHEDFDHSSVKISNAYFAINIMSLSDNRNRLVTQCKSANRFYLYDSYVCC